MKKGFTLVEIIAVILIMGIIGLIVIPSVNNSIKNSKEKSYEAQIQNILEASKKWAIDNSDKLPDESGLGEIGINLDDLLRNGYITKTDNGRLINPINKENMTGCVKVKYSVEYKQYIYEYDEACQVKTTDNIGNIAKRLVYNSNTCKTDGTTYQYMNGCYLKGAQSTNYVWFSGFLYRIMGINSDGSVRMITEENVTAIPYNVEGNINFIGSHAESWLNEYFLSNLKGTDIIVDGKFCQGATNSTANLQRTDCIGGTEITKKIGLISIDEYNLSGAETSYLKNAQLFRTVSPYSASNAWDVGGKGAVSNGKIINANGLRPIINVKLDTIVISGEGTESNNYTLGEDKLTNITGKLNEKAFSGEYVKLANKIYRVVGKNNDGTIKLIYDGYYQEMAGTNYTMKYGADNVFTKENKNTSDITLQGVGYKLNNDVLNWLVPVSDTINRNKIKTDSKWYQNKYDYGQIYTESIKENGTPIEATVGLIRVGEMLSGQSASISIQKYYWILTEHPSTSLGWYMLNYGYASNGILSMEICLRPVININSNVTITKGNGTLSMPYEI